MSTEIAETGPRIESGSMLPLIQQALAQNVDPAKLERMLDLHERWTLARAQEAFGSALSAFQAEMPMIEKKRVTTGGKWNFHYASLDDVMKVAQPILARHNISLTFDSQHTTQDKGPAVINVTLKIRVGSYAEERRFGCPVPTDLNASQPQQWGAALSYAKRYALCAALNIVVTDEDTEILDAKLTDAELDQLELLLTKTKTDREKFLAWAQSPALEEIPRSLFPKAIQLLKTKAGGK